MADSDREANRFSARAARYARVGANMGGVAARMAGSRLFGGDARDASNAAVLAQALGGLKGPIMKVAQLLATIPDLIPPEYAAELQKLQSEAPPMGQVHRAITKDGERIACKLQYPDMQSAVEADLSQLELVFALHRRMDPAIDTREIAKEIGERVREELDYEREAKHAALYARTLADVEEVRVPRVHPELSTRRLLSLEWLEGEKILQFTEAPVEIRNRLAIAMFKAWWHPFSHAAVIHGDPHLGNYTVFSEGGEARGINLLDYGCIRIFHPRFVGGVVDLYRGLQTDDRARVVHAYETWGFKSLSNELIDILNIWARFIYAPLLDDRVRTVADGVKPGEYGRRQAFEVHKALKEKGPVTVPREFVFMDRAAVGLGAVFLHLKAELNYHRLFENEIERFSLENLEQKQKEVLAASGLPNPV
jgi:predicted unusual protein kinase regulating ubiquinone biosynthesis (AarF/ABC1/UbiB family)